MIRLSEVVARDIPDAWFQLLFLLLEERPNEYIIQKGSYEGQTRLEFDYITVQIKFPYSEPYDTMLPEIPAHFGIPNPVEPGYTEQYLPYILTPHKEPNEQYTYGERMEEASIHWEQELSNTPMTNQAILQIGKPSDWRLSDPPCLRHIDIRVKNNRLNFFVYFRSWDLWGGFPANLAALAIKQKEMADETGFEMGQLIGASKGLHLYGYAENLAKIRCMKNENG